MTPEEQLEKIHEWAAWVVFDASDGKRSIRLASRSEYLTRYQEGIEAVIGADEETLTPETYFRYKGMWLHPERCAHPDIQADVEWDALPNGKERKAAKKAYWAKWERVL